MPMDKAERKEITQIKESIPRLDEDIDAISSALERTAHEVVDRDKKRKQTQQTLEAELSQMRGELDSKKLDAPSIVNNWGRAIQLSAKKA